MRIYNINDKQDKKNKFYQVPQALIKNPKYKELTSDAKLIYTLLLDRMSLSRKNGWTTEEGHIFQYYAREEIAEQLNISKKTVDRAYIQLKELELITEQRQGQGKQNIMFVCYADGQIDQSRKDKLSIQETSKSPRSNTDVSHTEFNHTENNEKGTRSDEACSAPVIKPLEYRDEISKVRKYFAELYKYHYGKEYHKHKAKQNRHIDEQLNHAFHEYCLDIENMCDMMKAYFVRVKCDHNLMHFVTEGIIQNRMYEEAY